METLQTQPREEYLCAVLWGSRASCKPSSFSFPRVRTPRECSRSLLGPRVNARWVRELRDRSKERGTSKSAESSKKKRAGDHSRKWKEGRADPPATCFGCGKKGHTVKKCRKGKTRGGNSRGKSKRAAGARLRRSGTEASGVKAGESFNNLTTVAPGTEAAQGRVVSQVLEKMAERPPAMPTHPHKEAL